MQTEAEKAEAEKARLRRLQEEEERRRAEEAEEEERRRKRENSLLHKVFTGLKTFGKKMVEDEEDDK